MFLWSLEYAVNMRVRSPATALRNIRRNRSALMSEASREAALRIFAPEGVVVDQAFAQWPGHVHHLNVDVRVAVIEQLIASRLIQVQLGDFQRDDVIGIALLADVLKRAAGEVGGAGVAARLAGRQDFDL